jgi:hypothetical protein
MVQYKGMFACGLANAHGVVHQYWRFTVERDLIPAWPENPESGYQIFFIIPLPQ